VGGWGRVRWIKKRAAKSDSLVPKSKSDQPGEGAMQMPIILKGGVHIAPNFMQAGAFVKREDLS
jgi:hypothetical protein